MKKLNIAIIGLGNIGSYLFKYLEDNHLLDLGHNELLADRCYSALVKDGDGYKSKSYMQAFKKETTAVVDALEEEVVSMELGVVIEDGLVIDDGDTEEEIVVSCDVGTS